MFSLATVLLQQRPFEDLPPEFYGGAVVEQPGFSIGQVLLFFLIGAGFQTLFGFWGRAKAEEHGVNPWAGFAAGFFLGYIGVRIVPLLKPDSLFFQPKRRPVPGMFVPPGQPVPPQAYPQQTLPPQAAPGAAQAWAPPPQPAAAPPAPVAPAAPVVSADGYLQCPNCGARAKVGRRTCMSCGTTLPRL
ncbi:MAG: hypothetical protein HS108_05615 [Planctomycetes bacterium]|jgi:hypothetical protein|nr:hypothetical protein [Planctomycetota bacterium]MCL4729085.1 hypothetical protein [Planctomycetota bacterium]